MNFTQTDTAAPLGVIQACSPVAPAGDADANEAVVGGTAGVTAVSCGVPNASQEMCYADELRIADSDTLAAGTLTHRLNVSTAQGDLTLEDIYVCRVNSSGVSQETLGSETGLATDISAGGVFTTNITLSAASAHNAGDRVYITVAVANAHSHTSRTLEILPNQNIDTPFESAFETVQETVSESLSAADSPATSLIARPSLSEALALTDSPADVASVIEALSDGLALTESPTGIATLREALSDGLVASDSLPYVGAQAPQGSLMRIRFSSEPAVPPEAPDAVSPAPTISEISRTDENMTLEASWADVADEDEYEWYAGANDGSWEDGTEGTPNVEPADTTSVQFTVPRQTVDHTGFFCVKACNAAGCSVQVCNGFTVQGTTAFLSDDLSLTDSVTDSVTPAGGGGDFPNEPSGYSAITERSFSAFKEDGWNNVGEGGNYQVPITDAGAPISPSDVGQGRYPTGFTGGVASHNTWRNYTATPSQFIGFAFKLSSNWQGHSSGVNKILFTMSTGGGEPALVSFGQDMGTMNLQLRLQGTGDERSLSGGPNIGGNVGDASIVRDTWYKAEVLMIANTGSNFDGELHIWINGSKTHEYTDVRYFDDGTNHEFDGIKWNPTWGGTGDTVEETQYQWVDHIYVSAP